MFTYQNVPLFEPRKQDLSLTFTRSLAGVKYVPDNSGQDTYILMNQGGVTVTNPLGGVNSPLQPSRINAVHRDNRRVSPTFASALFSQKPMFYRPDGQGRDTYILSGNGGFTTTNLKVAQDPRMTFAASLRGYEPNPDYLSKRRHTNMSFYDHTAEAQLLKETARTPVYQHFGDVPASTQFKKNNLMTTNLDIPFQKRDFRTLANTSKSSFERLHPNSISPVASRIRLNVKLPGVPVQGATQRDYDRVAKY